MGRKKLSNAEKARRYMEAHPTAKPKEVAAALEIPVATVYAAKYKTSPTKAKPKEVNIDAAHGKWQTLTAVTSNTPVPKAVADMVNQPPHYTAGGIETIDFLQAKLTREEFIGYLKGNVLKYGSRLGKKGNIDIDAGKMAWYALKLRDMLSVAQ
jgi:hypothetical protein